MAARLNGGVAQLGEHLPCKQGVKSSNLSVSTRDDKSRTLYLENFIQKDFDETTSTSDEQQERCKLACESDWL